MNIIKKEIVIESAIAKVWKYLTDPEKIAAWLMPNDFEAVAGRKFFLECQHQGKISCVVKEIVPNERLVYGFQPRDFAMETLVTITLAKAGKATRLTLVHSGWDALPPDQRGMADNYDGGWGPLLENLKEQFTTTTN
jgi:uncharacterized protein YndB with AHSA1/START domain